MRHTDRICFEALKQAVTYTYRQTNPEAPEEIGEWKGKEIEGFQNDLLEKASGRISAKWFYTHIKGEQDSLPRIDVLNLLCQYIGHDSWDDFLNHLHKAGVIGENASDSEQVELDEARKKGATVPWKEYGVAVVALAILALVSWSWGGKEKEAALTNANTFCFYDADFERAIPGNALTITLLPDGESPRVLMADENGCVAIGAAEETEKIRFVVAAEMYRTDTITRSTAVASESERILLKRDDYAWLIHAFSSANITDWERRREQLNRMFHNDAIIFQVAGEQSESSMELYNKDEFIAKLLVPTSGLRDLKIIETHYADDRIIELRFVQKKS